MDNDFLRRDAQDVDQSKYPDLEVFWYLVVKHFEVSKRMCEFPYSKTA